jgi:hypothetical protein
VRLQLTDALLAKLAERVRLVRENWLERVVIRDRELEAEGYQYLDLERCHIKLGRIQADMWRHMIDFAIAHDVRRGHSPWHIFDASPRQINLYTETQTSEMNPGYHLILSTRPIITASTGGNENVDLIWNAPRPATQGSGARGRRDCWGCDTAVCWLKDEFLPMLIDLRWPVRKARTPIERILRQTREIPYRPRVNDVFCFQKATDWSATEVRDWASLAAMLSDLQCHYSLRDSGEYPGAHVKAADEALQLVIKLAVDPECTYIASNAELESGKSKEDLLHQLGERLRGAYSTSSAFLLDCRLRAVLAALGEGEDTNLNSAECQMVADILRP